MTESSVTPESPEQAAVETRVAPPVIALVGRPNVGKSTLFNRMTRTKDALVADFEGLTRDRKYGEGEFEGKRFIVVDTGGITGDETGIDKVMAQQSYTAMDEADVVLFVVDAQSGMTAADQVVAEALRQRGKACHLVVNKVDGLQPEAAAAEFFSLGVGEKIFYTAATHNRGIRSMLEEILEPLPVASDSDELGDSIRVGIIGRPNVGKSTLVNRLLGEERVVVFDHPGTTRDSVYIPYERQGKRYTLIDTAGVRRRKNVDEHVEKFSIIKTLQAVSDAHVVILVIDAREGIVDQDLHLLGYALEKGRSLVIAINKWDGMSADQKARVKAQVELRLGFVNWAPVHFISALHGTGVGHLYDTIHACHESAFAKWSTRRLTDLLQDAVKDHPPPLVRGRRSKLRMAHQGGSNPPRVIVHGNLVEELPNSYKRYLENVFRRELKVVGNPVRFEFRSGENPYAGKTNTLTPRQLRKRARLIQHVKKAEKKKKKKLKRGR
ncbi:ribosome biogenesis GTPase Der [Hahella sp. SMD15-11]|uniref:GTPase Der n=1 Tax=Thermohahella caldifontis TaxID=3142973 RepID=A0AB39UYL2_9GAMM